jgi:hypothetical protein
MRDAMSSDDTEMPTAPQAMVERRSAPPVDVAGDDGSEFDEPEPLPIATRRRRVGVVTAVLALAAMGAAGFYAGVVVQKHQKAPASTSATQSLASRFGSGRFAAAGGAAAGGGAAGGAGRVAGVVKLIDGSNIYVTDAQGNTVKVATGTGAQFSKTVSGALADVKIGDRIAVQGPQAGDGTYQAQQVTLGAAAGGGRGAGAGAGAGAAPSG